MTKKTRCTLIETIRININNKITDISSLDNNNNINIKIIINTEIEINKGIGTLTQTIIQSVFNSDFIFILSQSSNFN